MTESRTTVLDRPWHRPGALAYALHRLAGIARPPVTLTEPAPGDLLVDRDVEVTIRDGTVLRVNVHRPVDGQPAPVILSAHPYGKDNLPLRPGKRPRMPRQYRLMRQPAPVVHSVLTGWEAPDPAWWVAKGYVVINADLRGCGHSDGVGALMSDQEAEDIHDIIEWAAAQPWSSGRVGMLGVSYLAISQYKVAALAPPSLVAICPWEGMTDAYRDLMYPGGVREDGFTRLYAHGIRRTTRVSTDIARLQREHPLRDDPWQAFVPALDRIRVPMLECTSFSDNNLHTRGSFRAFTRAGSAEKFAYTHRGGKWQVFYSQQARAAQLTFLERYLRGADVPAPPRVRLEVREDRDTVAEVRQENDWPLANTSWERLHLASDGRLVDEPPASAGSAAFHTRRNAAAFTTTFTEDTELTGPMALRLWLSVATGDDVDLFIGVEKWRGSRYVTFEGSYGWGRDRVATGWQKASLRELDERLSTPWEPVPTFLRPQPLTPGEVVSVDIALGPSATLFRAGESLRLVVAGRWLSTRNPLTGHFPAHYRRGPATYCTLHWSPERPAHLLVPHIPR